MLRKRGLAYVSCCHDIVYRAVSMLSFADSPLVGGGFECGRLCHGYRTRWGGSSSSFPAASFVVVLLLLLLTSCVHHGAAWTPPNNYEDATFTGSTVLSGNTDMSLSGVSAFTLRIKGALDLDFSNYGRLFQLLPSGSTTTSMQFHQLGNAYGGNKNKIGFYVQKGSASNRCGYLTTNSAWADANTVIDIVLSFDGTRAKIYVNGAFEGQSSVSNPTCAMPTFHQFQMGGSDSSNSAIKGTVRFFTVWSGTALSSSQASEMYADNYANIPSPTHHYALNEGASSTTAYDWMGNGTALSFTGGSWTNRLQQPCACMRDMGFTFKGGP